MATFFGEVTEISSRAVWWSDSDEDEADEDKIQQVSYTSEVINETLLATFQAQCKLAYVSICKKAPQLGNDTCILRVKMELGKKSIKGYIASLYQLCGTEYWLLIDNKLATEFGNFSSRLVDFIADNVFPPAKASFDVFIISKDLTRWEYLQYFSSNTVPQRLAQLVKVTDLRPMISPETVKNEFELALLEYCIVQKLNFACFLLPSECAETLSFIPKQITESINEFALFPHLNII